MKQFVISDQPNEHEGPIYAHLEPVVDALLKAGNKLSRRQRWGSTKEGFVCYLEGPIDFALVRRDFVVPESIVLSEQRNLIACAKTWATIYGSIPRKGDL